MQKYAIKAFNDVVYGRIGVDIGVDVGIMIFTCSFQTCGGGLDESQNEARCASQAWLSASEARSGARRAVRRPRIFRPSRPGTGEVRNGEARAYRGAKHIPHKHEKYEAVGNEDNGQERLVKILAHDLSLLRPWIFVP